jgi:DNA mismatch repair protein MutS2
MNEKSLHILEYDKVIGMLVSQAHSAPGKKLCEELLPMTDLRLIEQAQTETADAVARTIRLGRLSFAGNRDLSFSLNALSLSSCLSMAELIHIAEVCECAARVFKYGEKEHPEEESDSLTSRFEALHPLENVSREIRRCLISEEEVADDASPELKNIRRQRLVIGDKIHTELNHMVNTSLRTYLQDAVITMRNNRYCLPVKAEYKNAVHGMIHDQSKAGSTFFIEPAQIVEYNNKLSELESAEKEEIEKILLSLSSFTGEYTAELAADCKVLSELDYIFAKASLALLMKAAKPEYVSERILEIRKARHPFIDATKVVPIDIRLGDDYLLLIVTGPNTGGKTVSLKTTGLLCAMGQAGLHIPALSTSKFCVFREIYADIGDEQSIEQSLSTFSAHMTNIISILRHADEDCLCLFDELCAGTDPSEGAALAIAILRSLRDRGTLTMATTHYSELKIFASTAALTKNASCEFNVETLSPTYKLLIGIPGKSNAFAISSKLGLPNDIIEDAKKEITESRENFEDVIAGLGTLKKELEEKEASIESSLEEIERLRSDLEERNTNLEERKEKILRKANEEAREILEDAKETADAAIRSYHKGTDIRDMEKTRDSLRNAIKDKKKNLTPKVPEKADRRIPKPEEIKKGDYLEIMSMQLSGYVKSLPDAKGNFFITCGMMQIKTNTKDVCYAKEPEAKPVQNKIGKGGNYSGTFSKAKNISPEINLLGQTADEAIANLDKYLDDAYMSHLHSVRVVHGKGTGVLRDAVAKHLRKLSYVESFHLGEYGEGDAGVTIVNFK